MLTRVAIVALVLAGAGCSLPDERTCSATSAPVSGSSADFTLSSSDLGRVEVKPAIPCRYSGTVAAALPLVRVGDVTPSDAGLLADGGRETAVDAGSYGAGFDLARHLSLSGRLARGTSVHFGRVCAEGSSQALVSVQVADWKATNGVVKAVADEMEMQSFDGEVLVVVAPTPTPAAACPE